MLTLLSKIVRTQVFRSLRLSRFTVKRENIFSYTIHKNLSFFLLKHLFMLTEYQIESRKLKFSENFYCIQLSQICLHLTSNIPSTLLKRIMDANNIYHNIKRVCMKSCGQCQKKLFSYGFDDVTLNGDRGTYRTYSCILFNFANPKRGITRQFLVFEKIRPTTLIAAISNICLSIDSIIIPHAKTMNSAIHKFLLKSMWVRKLIV